jgi:hypothetical protein
LVVHAALAEQRLQVREARLVLKPGLLGGEADVLPASSGEQLPQLILSLHLLLQPKRPGVLRGLLSRALLLLHDVPLREAGHLPVRVRLAEGHRLGQVPVRRRLELSLGEGRALSHGLTREHLREAHLPLAKLSLRAHGDPRVVRARPTTSLSGERGREAAVSVLLEVGDVRRVRIDAGLSGLVIAGAENARILLRAEQPGSADRRHRTVRCCWSGLAAHRASRARRPASPPPASKYP